MATKLASGGRIKRGIRRRAGLRSGGRRFSTFRWPERVPVTSSSSGRSVGKAPTQREAARSRWRFRARSRPRLRDSPGARSPRRIPSVRGRTRSRVSWVDNSDNEGLFEVQLLYRGVALQRRKFVRANTESTLMTSLFTDTTYSVRVFAHGTTGTSASTRVAGSFGRRRCPVPGAVSDLTARATGDTSVRSDLAGQFARRRQASGCWPSSRVGMACSRPTPTANRSRSRAWPVAARTSSSSCPTTMLALASAASRGWVWGRRAAARRLRPGSTGASRTASPG